MDRKQFVILAFILVALIQLYVPASMIFSREKVLTEGRKFKFKTAPVDPNDPFRGKFITLSFDENTFKIENKDDWANGQTVFVHLDKDGEGFAKIIDVSKEAPARVDYVKAEISYVSVNNELFIEYPFTRFYMEESKAPRAEETYWDASFDEKQITYALVSIKDGDAVLENVLINDIPIGDIVIKQQQIPVTPQ